MTKSLADQVSALKDGDYVRAVFISEDAEMVVKGTIRFDGANSKGIKVSDFEGTYILDFDGDINPDLISLTDIDRPLPPEPELGSFTLCNCGLIAHRRNNLSTPGAKNWKDGDEWFTWDEVYPRIIKMWNPKGEEITP